MSVIVPKSSDGGLGGGRQLRGAGGLQLRGQLRQQASFSFPGSFVSFLLTICRRELAMAQSFGEEWKAADGVLDSSDSEVNTDDQSHAPQRWSS